MDDSTFQQELTRLKHHVSLMDFTIKRNPQATQSPTRSDQFYYQLYDLKARLESMQASLSSLTWTPTQTHATRASPPAEMYSTPQPMMSALPKPHGQLTLPSGPLFWQLFTSLRTDVRSLDSRVASLEQHVSDIEDRVCQNVSELEDRIDRLDPSQITPAASEDSPLYMPHGPHIQSSVQPFVDSWALSSPTIPNCSPWSPYPKDWRSPNVAAPIDHFAANTSSHLDTNFNNTSPASEGVAFRDREIAQLDELMRKAQESIQHSDAVISEKDSQIQQLGSQRELSNVMIKNLQQVIHTRDKTLRSYEDMVNERDGRAEHLEAQCQSKDAALQAWAAKHYAMQQSFLEKKTQLYHADRQIQQLQNAVNTFQTNRDAEMDEMISSKNEEISKLREFCEAKEAVAHQQEQIIARGATLLEDRDAELARLGQQMKSLDDDLRNETRERARFARLLDERDEDIGQLKVSLSHALMPKSGQSKQESDNVPSTADRIEEERKAPSYYPLSPFATAGTSGRRAASGGSRWTPKAIENYAPLPHEQRRASLWTTGLPIPEKPKFGIPGAFAPSRPADANTPAKNHSRDLRRSDSVKLLQRLALAEEDARSPTRSTTASSSTSSKRVRLPLDDVSSRPPLPARVPPRKMASVIELGSRPRHDGDTDHQRPISRHQSIQQLPRHRLQAYVEDGMSGGDA